MERSTGGSSGPPAYTLRAATADDVAFIHALRASGLREHVERIWGWDENDQRERFRRRFVPASYQVIVVDGRDIGAISVEWGSDGVFLDDIEIAAEWRGRGLGTAVVGGILTEAQRRGLPVRLQVLRGNPARRWYERLGFERIGETATHIAMRAPPPGSGAGGIDGHRAG